MSQPDWAAREWRAYLEPLGDLGELIELLHDPSDPQLRHEMYRMLHSGVAAAFFGSFLGDAEHPDFWPWDGIAFNYWGPNPDNTYLIAPLDDQGVYRVTGMRGTVSIVDVQIGTGPQWVTGTGSIGPVENHDLDELTFQGPDREFDVLLSSERPTGHDGAWWPIPPETRYIMVRQTANDWTEQDARFAIDRLDTPAIRPRLSADQIAAKLRGVAGWSRNWSADAASWVAKFRNQGLVNKVMVTGIGEVHSTLMYVLGSYDLKPGQALVYETDLPERCRYWNVQTTDDLWSGLDWVNRQVSLNGHQAHIDTDGRFRAVISATDPGVPNWIDTAGYAKGGIVGRWYDADTAPCPAITTVDAAGIRGVLPADTPTVDPAARDATIRARRRAAQLRRRW